MSACRANMQRPLLLPAAPLGIVGSLVLALGPASVPALAAGRVLSGLALGLVDVGEDALRALIERLAFLGEL